jgi:N-acetylglutamate synthase-like GNAT family acetyltransferase
MHTYLLGDDEVRRFALGMASRLGEMGTSAPKVWFTLGVSGDKMAAEIGKLLGPKGQPNEVYKLGCARPANTIFYRGPKPSEPRFNLDVAFVVDSAVHSGSSFTAAANFLHKNGVRSFITYSLVVKRSSSFIPTYFGLLIGEHDRAYFQLEEIPSNRLSMSRTPVQPFGHMRAICADDAKGPPRSLNTGTPSIDAITFADLWYDVKAHGKNVYFFEVGGDIAGLVAFKMQSSGVMLLDTIARDKSFKGLDVGGIMWRWAETFARSSRCAAIDIWAIQNKIGWYKTLGFEEIPNETLDLGPAEKYQRMRRRILYNVKPEDMMV